MHDERTGPPDQLCGRQNNTSRGSRKYYPLPGLAQFGVRAVAKWRRGRVLAHSPSNPLLLRDDHLDRLESLVLVHPVAKRLRGRIPAGTPPISASLNLKSHWLIVAYNRFFSHRKVIFYQAFSVEPRLPKRLISREPRTFHFFQHRLLT